MDITRSIDRAQRAARRAADRVQPTQMAAVDQEELANDALPVVVPEIQGCLLRNLKNSKIRSVNPKEDRRGHADVEEAVRGSKIWCKVIGGNLILRYGLKPGMSERTYIAVAALNYGSVNGSSLIKRVKQQVKKKVLASGVTNKTVRAARGFYALTGSQLSIIKPKLLAEMARLKGAK